MNKDGGENKFYLYTVYINRKSDFASPIVSPIYRKEKKRDQNFPIQPNFL